MSNYSSIYGNSAPLTRPDSVKRFTRRHFPVTTRRVEPDQVLDGWDACTGCFEYRLLRHGVCLECFTGGTHGGDEAA